MLSDFLLILVIITSIKGELARGFTGRPSLVANLVSISAVFLPRWNSLWVGWQWYLYIGWFFGAIAFVTYMFNERLHGEFYTLSWLFYNSVFAALICLYFGIVG
jgi:hypothetical protein